jgi:hypothetical protein
VRSDEAGSTLLLFPAAILVLLALGGIAVDSATLFLSQRRMADLAAAVAHDAIAGLEEASFYGEGVVRVDPRRASLRRDQLIAHLEQDWSLSDVSCTLSVSGDRATADCAATVRPIMAALWWGDGTRTRRVSAVETSRGTFE